MWVSAPPGSGQVLETDATLTRRGTYMHTPARLESTKSPANRQCVAERAAFGYRSGAMSAPSPASLVPELASHATVDAIVSAVREHLLEAASELHGEIVSHGAGDLELDVDALQTPWGNVREVLGGGPSSATTRALLAAVIALAIRSDFPSAPETEKRRALDLVRLAAHHRVDALSAVDVALGEAAGTFWSSVAALVNELTPAEAVVAVLSLKQSKSESAIRATQQLAAKETEPSLLRALLVAPAGQVEHLNGELAPPPRHPALTIVLALTGVLFFVAAVRLVGRLALAYRRPAELRVSERGVEVAYRTELLGRVLRDRSTLVPLANVRRLTREVRFARFGLYAGLVAVCIGSYLGMGLLVDGARVPGTSPPLLGMGLLIIGVGVALDFGLSLLGDAARGRCRVLVEQNKGPSFCVGAVDRDRTDAFLNTVAKRAAQS